MILATLFLFAAVQTDPYIGYLSPSVVAAGTTNRIIVGGQNFGKVTQAWASGGGVRILGVEEVPRLPFTDGVQRKYLQGWLDAIERGETAAPPLPELKPTDIWRTNRWWQALDTLGPRERDLVSRNLWVRNDPLQSAPSLASRLLITLAVDADAAPGRRQLRVYRDNAVSEPRPLDIVAGPVYEEPRYVPPSHNPRPYASVAVFPCAVSGCIMPGETDVIPLRLTAGSGFSIAVAGRAYQPYIGDAVPGFFNPVITLKASDGREIAFADDFGRWDPDPHLVCDIPADGDYTLEIHDVLFRGREDFVYTVFFGYGGENMSEKETALPYVCEFEVSAPCRRVIDVKSRRIGSCMDARVKLLDASDRVLGVWDDVTNSVHVGTVTQQELDPTVVCDLPAAGRYRAVVEDTCARRGPGIYCTVEVREPRPSFRLVSHRSGFVLGERNSWPRRDIVFSVERLEGFEGPIVLRNPADLTLKNAKIPSGTNEWTVTMSCSGTFVDAGLREFEIEAVGESAAGEVRGEVIAADEYDQAFAWRHLVSFGKFIYLCRRLPKPAKKGK